MQLPTFDPEGPAPTWPRPVDAALEWWAALPARGRAGLRAAVAVVVLVTAGGGLLEGPWGPPVAVVVTTRDVTPGSQIDPAAVAVAHRPRQLVPLDALADLAGLPQDAVADGHLPAGTVLTQRAVVGGGPSTAAVAGTAVVPLAAADLPALPVGTRLDLAVAGVDGGAEVVATDAVLVADDGTWRWVRVERDAVAGLARGLSGSTLVVAVLPPLPAAAP